MKTVILAGGEGRRIGGNKPLKPLFGKPLIYWVFKKASIMGLPVGISVKTKEQEELIKKALLQEGVPSSSFFFIKDVNPELMGPISGIFSALKFFKDEDPLLILAVDQPFLNIETLWYLKTLSEIFCHKFLIVHQGKEKIHPFPGIYPAFLKAELEFFLKHSSKRSLFRLFMYLQKKNLVLFVNNDKMYSENFININTLQTLKEMEECVYQSLIQY